MVSDKVETREASLGDLTLSVPLAIGTLQWGTTWIDEKVINRTGLLSEPVCQEIIEIVSASGVTLFDTAEGYGGGTSEKRLGRLLDPSKHLYMTKFLPSPWRAFHSDFERAVRQSCQRLGIEKIHIYLLHSPVHWRPIEFWVEAAAKCHRKGFLEYLGLSNANADQVRRGVVAGRKYGVTVICNQVHYSLLDYNSVPLREMQKVCEELNVTIVGFSPIGQGLLTDHLTDEKWASNKPAKMLRIERSDLDPLRSCIKEMSVKYKKSMAQVSLNWCMQHNVVPLVGCRSVRQARDSMGSLGWALYPQDVLILDHVALDKSTLESPVWRRSIFVTLFGIVNIVCRFMDQLGFGRLDLKGNKED
jgi:pyridoxine 4-dehydrogenase